MFTIKYKRKKTDEDKDNKDKHLMSENSDDFCFFKCISNTTLPMIVKNVITENKEFSTTKKNVKLNVETRKITDTVKENISSNIILTPAYVSTKETRSKRKATLENNENNNEVKRLKFVEKMTKCKLAVIPSLQISSTNFESISAETLVEAMEKYGTEFNNKFTLIDCRFPYQYKAGHIRGAVNFYDTYEIFNFFFSRNNKDNTSVSDKVPIFYYTESKEPQIISKLCEVDVERKIYPNIYLINGGYEKFFRQKIYQKYCDPCGYVKPSLHAYLKDKNEINKRRSKMK